MSDYEPKPIAFDDSRKIVMPKEPGALSFSDDSATKKQLNDNVEKAVKSAIGNNVPQSLKFGNTPSTSTTPSKPVVAARTVFEVKQHSRQPAAIAIAKAKYGSSCAKDLVTIEKQIGQLLDSLDDATISSWADSQLQAQMAVSSRIAALIKQHVQMDVDKTVDAAMQHVNGKSKGNIWDRVLFKDGSQSELMLHKSHLTIAKSQMSTMITNCTSVIREIDEIGGKLLTRMVAMTAVAESLGSGSSVEISTSQRSSLLLSAVTQNQLLHAQVKQMHDHLSNLMPQIDQLLNVTLPAMEIANATRK